jgi:hypothetical protein
MLPEGDDLIDRRRLLVGGAGILLAAGCSTSSDHSSTVGQNASAAPRSGAEPTASTTRRASEGASPTTSPSPASSRPTTSEQWPRVSAWRPSAGEVNPTVKLEAVRVVEELGSWEVGHSGVSAAASRVAALGQPGTLARQALPLLGRASRAIVQVIDAQYGGILATSASVLVVCRQWRAGPDGRLIVGGTTVDVRLRAHRGHWAVEALHPAHPGKPSRALPPVARRVLASSRIALPAASVADIRSGQVHASTLRALLVLAQDFRIDVSVVRSGHPRFVFGTDRLSDHPRGRAFDTWRINGHAVVDPRTPKSLVVGYMRAAAAAGSYNVGGPYQVLGHGNQFFTDATHHDHVHVGFLG